MKRAVPPAKPDAGRSPIGVQLIRQAVGKVEGSARKIHRLSRFFWEFLGNDRMLAAWRSGDWEQGSSG